MARHISEIGIQSYRGITNFAVNDLSDINIIVGENNCGKTSLLEAIQIINRPCDFENIVMVSRQRDRFSVVTARYTQSQYSSFLNIFNRFQKELNISLNCKTLGNNIKLSLVGEIYESLVGEDQLAQLKTIAVGAGSGPAIDEEVKAFFGRLDVDKCDMFVSGSSIDVMLNKYSRIMRSNSSKALCPINYISPIDHTVNDRFNEITRSKEMTRRVVELLQTSFDPEIQDLRTVEDEDGRSIRMIDHQNLGFMPLSTYGDGIKKAIALANAAASIRDGVLLIDEYETAIHPKAMDRVFEFMINVCMEKNIQLFLTTHSDEALERLLQSEGGSGNIRVITMFKNAGNTSARVLDGNKALLVRNELGLELRQ